MPEGKCIGVISLKGGVGKTSVVANLGATLAKDFGKKVLVIDANFSTPHLGIHLGFLQPPATLHQVLNNSVSASQAIYQHPLGLHVMAGSLAPMEVNPMMLKEKIMPLKELYDVILIDSSPALNDEMYATMSASDELLVVSSPDYPTLSATLQAVQLAKRKKAPIRGIVINKVHGKKFELSKRDIEQTSAVNVLSLIPSDIKVLEALAAMTPVSAYAPKREVSQEFKKLAGILIGEPYSQPKLFARAKSAFKNLGKKSAERRDI